MPRLLVYVMVKSKMPKIAGGTCILKGCNKRYIRHAKIKDWIIGIGGRTLCKGAYDRKLIYAMKVESGNPPKSRNFTYYGDEAIFLDGFKKIMNIRKRPPSWFDNPDLYQRFNKFMDSQPKGKIGSCCCRMPCKPKFC